ncbi:MAG: two-component regulator propeller domain-containing protein, partial [Ignavibacteriaceae bacterium]
DPDDSASISDGLILSLYEDKDNTLWIGTNTGLNKFNRKDESFTSYKNNPENLNTISNNIVKCIYEDLSGRLWVGTREGLNLFDRNNKKFLSCYFAVSDSELSTTLTPNQSNVAVTAIIQDPGSEDLLLGINRNGLWRFSIEKRTISRYNIATDDNSDKKIGYIQSFCLSKDGKLWIASLNSLSSFDFQSRQFKSYVNFPIRQIEMEEKPTKRGSVIQDKSGLIWFGFHLYEMGVGCLNPENGRLQQYKIVHSTNNLININIYSIFEDKTGIIWIGTWGQGLWKLDKRKNKFHVLESKPNYKSTNHAYVNSEEDNPTGYLGFDSNGFLWLTSNQGIIKYDSSRAKFIHFSFSDCIGQNAYVATIDKKGYIWIGTESCGLIRFDPVKEDYSYYFSNPEDSINLVKKRLWDLIEDQYGILWAATDGFGLYKIDASRSKITHYQHNPDDSLSLGYDFLRKLYEDASGNIWVGLNVYGLNKYDRSTDRFYKCNVPAFMAIYEDNSNNFWVGGFNVGLLKYDPRKNKIIAKYDQTNGLAHAFIHVIFEDKHNNLWMSTDKGVSKFNMEKETFRNYSKEDGLADNFFFSRNSGISPDGTLFLPTYNGELITFHPDSIRDDPNPPQVVLSNISLFNRPDEKLNYDGFISELKEITLPYDQNDLRFDFVGLHFSQTYKNQYKYILENFDDEWVGAGTQRNATYTNLDPGEYTFRVIAANKDGIWNEKGASINIIITPPWWRTSIAYLIYAIIIITSIYFMWKWQLKRIRIKQEFEMNKFEAEKLHEIDEMKSRFFANISHEFRTPLTLIFGPASDIAENSTDIEAKKNAGLIKRNADRLYNLVNQLLDLSKFEAGKMKLTTTEQNIIPLIRGLVLSFTSLAERRNITLNLKTDEEILKAYIDKEKLEKIINNLLSNAFKFTPEGGEIIFFVGQKDNNIEIKVSDTGTGIPKERIDKIFNRFYQVDGSHTREREGTGIGLSLTKELVELHKGKIFVESKEGAGTTFTVLLPLGKEHLKEEEIVEKEVQEEKSEIRKELELIPEIENRKEKTDIDVLFDTEKPLLLIVEDNSDVRKYIISHLEKDYRIQEAVDGEDGWNQAVKQIPDLIISDIMMPKMDGFELCNKLKTEADDYIMKPFDAKELQARIKNLIAIRKKLQEKFRSEDFVLPKEFSSLDAQFMQKAIGIINEHISEENFSIEEFASEIALSRKQLHRKLTALTGKTPSQFLRSIRLAKAKTLIKEKKGTISEISYQVGFNSPAYFNKCFKEEYGYSPGELNT